MINTKAFFLSLVLLSLTVGCNRVPQLNAASQPEACAEGAVCAAEAGEEYEQSAESDDEEGPAEGGAGVAVQAESVARQQQQMAYGAPRAAYPSQQAVYPSQQAVYPRAAAPVYSAPQVRSYAAPSSGYSNPVYGTPGYGAPAQRRSY